MITEPETYEATIDDLVVGIKEKTNADDEKSSDTTETTVSKFYHGNHSQ